MNLKYTVALALALASSAHAADMPVPRFPLKAPPPLPIADLTGFYLGAHAGASGSSQQTMFVTTPGVAAAAGLPGKLYPTGIPVGGLAGWGTSLGALYGAVEADFDLNNNKTSNTCSWPIAGNIAVNTICGSKPGWISTQRAMVGITLPTLTGAAGKIIPANWTPPSQWPLPVNVPSTLAAAPVMLLANVGIAEKAINGYVSPTNVGKTVFPGGSQTQTQMGFLVGGEVKLPLATGWNATLRYDHIMWNKSFTPAQSANTIAVFPATATFKQQPEDRLLAGLELGF